eukprot:scaffold89931_cov41-Attheya_sp.AAC.1
MELTSVVDTVHRKCLLGVRLPHGFPFYAWNAALTGYEPTYAFSAFPLFMMSSLCPFSFSAFHGGLL